MVVTLNQALTETKLEQKKMQNLYIVSPFFLDEFVPGLKAIAGPDWIINKPILGTGERQIRMADIYQQLARLTAQAIDKGKRPVIIAGDCCSSIAVFAGLQRAGIDPLFIWFDAHGDFNTWETTPSGFLGGMPLAMIAGRGEQTISNAVELAPVSEEKVILTDARDLDPEEKEQLRKSRVIHLRHINELNEHPLPESPIYVHVDMDIIDPEEVPAMNYPAPGGPSATELKAVFQRLAQTGRIAAVSVSSWNPDLDHDGQSEKICMDALKPLISDF